MASLKKCIEEYCKECIYDDLVPGTWRDQVEACTSVKCPLYEVRPVTTATRNARRAAKKGDGDIPLEEV